jgi:hypothetical protein
MENDLLTTLIQFANAAFWCSAHQNRRWPGQPAAVFLKSALNFTGEKPLFLRIGFTAFYFSSPRYRDETHSQVPCRPMHGEPLPILTHLLTPSTPTARTMLREFLFEGDRSVAGSTSRIFSSALTTSKAVLSAPNPAIVSATTIAGLGSFDLNSAQKYAAKCPDISEPRHENPD